MNLDDLVRRARDARDWTPKHRDPAVPDLIEQAVLNYVTRGWTPGSFTCAVLADDLRSTLYSADPDNREVLHRIVSWVDECVPAFLCGSRDVIECWRSAHRIADVEDKLQKHQEKPGDDG